MCTTRAQKTPIISAKPRGSWTAVRTAYKPSGQRHHTATVTFDGLRGLTYYGGYVYILDGSQHVLRRFDVQTQEVTTIAGQAGVAGNDGPGNQATFNSPRYMASDNSGLLFISDTQGAKVRTYNINTDTVGTFVGNGTQGYTEGIGQSAQIHRPRGLTSDGTSLYIAEFNQHTIRQGVIATQELSTNIGQHCGGNMPCAGGYQEGQGTANTQLNNPVGLAWHGPSGSMFVCDTGNHVIRRVR